MGDPDNGGYMNYGDDGESDFKRKADSKKDITLSDDEDAGRSGKPSEYFIKELLAERVQLQMEGKYPHSDRLLQQEIANAKQNNKYPTRDLRYVDIYNEKPIKVTVKVLVPIKEHPKFNFVGKILGPKGNSLRRLQEDTLCKMAVMGRGSMKDRQREENLRQSLDPKYAHLNDDLHVEISSLAAPAEAHARVAFALAEVRKYLIPDSNDEIRQEQYRELVADGVLPPVPEEEGYYRSSRGPPPPPPPPHSYGKRPSSSSHHRSRSPVSNRGVVPGKQKVLSILDRARTAMDDRYPPYQEEYEVPAYERGRGYSQEMDRPPTRTRTRDVEMHMDYRREYYRDASPIPPPPPPAYVKSATDHHQHHHHRSSSSSASAAGYPSSSSSSRSHHSHQAPPPADEHYAPRQHPSRYHGSGGGGGERSYRGSPYMRPPK